MRAVEVLGLVLYFYALQEATLLYTSWLMVDKSKEQIKGHLNSMDKFDHKALGILLPPGFMDHQKYTAWRGRCLEWFLMEIMVFIFFVSTMLILIIKSRFLKVGIDHSH